MVCMAGTQFGSRGDGNKQPEEQARGLATFAWELACVFRTGLHGRPLGQQVALVVELPWFTKMKRNSLRTRIPSARSFVLALAEWMTTC
eukprot:2554339-Amphidinium_carterae.1